MKRRPTLLVGNGVNRAYDNSRAWNIVLQQIASFTGTEFANDDRPLTLNYEELVLNHVKESGRESELKELVAQSMQNMESNELHRQIAQAGFKHIITTNYDYGIQKDVKGARSSNLQRELRYSLFRRHQMGSTNIWYIHGEVDKPRTIALGYEHYAGSLSKMRHFGIWDKKRKRTRNFFETHSRFWGGDTDFDTRQKTLYSWTDVFLRDAVHIIGLGLDYCEIYLWWILVLKARIRHGAFDSKNNIPEVGDTYYYYEGKKDEHIRVLESIGVQTVNIPIDNGWVEHYETALNNVWS